MTPEGEEPCSFDVHLYFSDTCLSRMLYADEATTRRDENIYAQIINLLKDLRARLNMSIILITHNFGIVDVRPITWKRPQGSEKNACP